MISVLLADVAILMVLMVIGVPVALCFAAAVLFLVLVGDYGSATFLVPAGLGKISSIVLVAIPLYILAGNLMIHGGLAGRLVDLAESLVGRFRGGMGIVVVLTMAVFGAISGMASSAVAAVGSILIPRMVELGYDRGYATSLVACSSVLALLFPPSASMILYGWVTNTSITALFLAPIVPGLILVVLYCAVNQFLTRRMPIIVPASVPAREVVADVANKTKRASVGLLLPIVILGCIYGGITTPTEAASVAVAFAIPVGFFVYKGLNRRTFYQAVWEAGATSGLLILLIFFAAMLARLFTMENVPQTILEALLAITESKIGLLLLINLFLIIVGMFLDDASGILLAGPMLLPVVQEIGVDPVQFGAIMGVSLGMGLITPPTAPILYFAGMIGKTTLPLMLKPTMTFIVICYLPVLFLTTFIPALSLALPRLVLGYGG
ncbi:TRAP transporter large permease (plasmid) [Paracoccus sp. Arc7-R13]|uniref:TRAP transporter large permease n=1 Tax=Paracoccus sp. Arc7-R13 TaxID=2500532 RepID=UPI000FDA2DDD|nr:TRAP transporter large permease [Paracoccus sp. Arc7-R13]AZY95521.1 TRAP transporter large permease [Paracoccus sp. Arc7-R13]